MYRSIPLILLLVACAGEEPKEDSTGGTEDTGCADATFWDITVKAKVEDADGAPLEGMEVIIDDLANTATGAFGTGTSDARGMVELLASQVEFREGCLGTLYNYQVIATDPEGVYAEASDDMNSNLYAATTDESMVADVTAFPLVMTAL